MTDQPRSFLRWREIPGGVWALGLVSLFMDVSSEMIHALLPLYLVTVLGTSTLTVGIIEGVAEATASITKVFSGALSDYLGKRKWLAAAGYGLAALTKPVFPMASSVGWLVAARFVDRIGKGIRGAPRDALIADLTPVGLRGSAYGMRQSLDAAGAVLGPLLAVVFMAALANDFTAVFWIAVIPAFISFAIIVFGVREPERPADLRQVTAPFSRAELARLNITYWMAVGVSAIFTLARFSEAFLLLRAQSAGLPVAVVPMVLVVMFIAYTASAWPAGALSDRVGRYGMIVAGFVLLMVADLLLALGTEVLTVMIGVALWGLHMGLTQGLLAALIADAAPAELRGTAFGVFNLVSGVALLAASIIAGALWDAIGPAGTFLAGAAFTAVALATLPFVRWRTRRITSQSSAASPRG
ncbi:MAG: MFS transporter [Pseudolabrys sp.]|nr:MFS transporter [Pseudolabrys sp.]MDP2297609.1 MFS transporter [Pseudolabrys sp.]